MLSKIPINIDKIKNNDKEIVRTAMIAELDAINLYEQMAEMTESRELKKILLDVAKEEKTHVGEFEFLLSKFDKEHTKELENGREEAKEEIEEED